MITDLVQIKRLGEKQREENSRFRAWMKRHNYAERRLKAIAQDVEDSMDCRQCANCCRVATTQVNERDLVRLARGIGMSVEQLTQECTTETPDEGRVLKRNENGCVFLEGNLCSVYEFRPGTCQLFPHLVKGAGSLSVRMWQMPDRAEYCPIVYNSLEGFKSETGFKK
jgi:Fe-S-cluster containining protein